MFNKQEVELITDALNMAIASNRRMQTSKPQFQEITNKIHTDLVNVQNKVKAIDTNIKTNK